MALDGFLIAYGSALIIPLSVVEGPIVSAITGALSARGYFDWWWALGLLVVGDLIGDLGYYWIGRSGKTRLGRLGRFLGVDRAFTPELQRGLAGNATRMLLIGKWTHSIGCVVLIGSGMMRMKLSRFLLVNLIGTLPKSALLFCLGYFAAGYLPIFEAHAFLGTVMLGLLGAAGIAFLVWRGESLWAGGARR